MRVKMKQTGCVDMVNALQSAGRRAFMPDTVECNNRVVANRLR